MRFTPKRKPLVVLDRTNLVISLLAKLTEKYDNSSVNIYFNCQYTQVDFEAKTVRIRKFTEAIPAQEGFSVDYDFLIDANGGSSVVRKHFLDTEQFEVEQKYITIIYRVYFAGTSYQNFAPTFFPTFLAFAI